jgi:hypothetical protein
VASLTSLRPAGPVACYGTCFTPFLFFACALCDCVRYAFSRCIYKHGSCSPETAPPENQIYGRHYYPNAKRSGGPRVFLECSHLWKRTVICLEIVVAEYCCKTLAAHYVFALVSYFRLCSPSRAVSGPHGSGLNATRY